MIDQDKEHLIPLRNAAKILPKASTGKDIHPTTLRRWTTDGVDGVVLDAVKIGGRLFTSTEAIKRFIQNQEAAGTTRCRIQAKTRLTPEQEARTKLILHEAGIEMPTEFNQDARRPA